MKAFAVIQLFETAPFKARHGDVVLIRDESVVTSGEDAKGVVAEGEVTGHAHRVTKAQALKAVDDMLQRVIVTGRTRGYLDHEEHKKSELPAQGKYRTGIQKQITPSGLRRVED